MFTIREIINNNEEIYIIIYCFMILWLNIDYLRVHKSVKKDLANISEDELIINTNSISVLFIGILFNLFRRWFIYLLAILVIGNIILSIITIIMFVVSLYHVLFNSSLESVKKSKIGLYIIIIDVLFISGFVIYLFLSI